MARTINEGIPKCFGRGETVEWYENRSDFLPADGWELTVSLVQSDDVQTFTATDNGDGRHLVTISASAALEFSVGAYRYQVRVTDGTKVHQLEHGLVDVSQSFADAGDGVDARAHAEIVLDAIQAVIEGKATGDQSSMAVGGKSISRYSWDELYQLRRRYQWEVRMIRDRERIARGEPVSTTRQVRFLG